MLKKLLNSLINELKSNRLTYTILLIWLLLWLYRLKPFLVSKIPFGYDPWIYKAIFQAYNNILPWINFTSLPSWAIHEPFLAIIGNFFHTFGVSRDWMVTRWIGILNLIPWIIIYLIFRRSNKIVWVTWVLLYYISITQYHVFWRNYMKQTLALSFMLLSLFFLESKKNTWFGIFFLVTLFLHRHTSVYLSATIFLYLVSQTITTKKIPWKIIIICLVAGISSLIFYLPMREKLLMWKIINMAQTTSWWEWFGGDFFPRIDYLKYSFVAIFLSAIWIVFKVRLKKFDIYFWWLVVWVLWTVLWLINFNRTLVFLDLFVIINAGFGIEQALKFYPKYKKYLLWFFWILFLVSSYKYFDYISSHSYTLISPEEFQTIKSLANSTEKNAIIMNTHRNYTPWIMGYTDRERLSPWMSQVKTWDFDWRVKRRSSDWTIKCQMLEEYKALWKPIYIFIGQQQFPENLQNNYCFDVVTNWWNYLVLKVR